MKKKFIEHLSFYICILSVGLIIPGCRNGAAKGASFDVPSMIGQDFSAASSMLGTPTRSEVGTISSGAARVASWDDEKGNTMMVFFDPVNKKPSNILFTVPDAQASSDKEKILKACNLSLDDTRYSLKFLTVAGDNKKIVGVTVKPLAP